MPELEHLPEVMCELVSFAESIGVKEINKLSGCWEHQLDEHWWFAVNGHRTPAICSKSTVSISPFSVYIMFNGWPAGIIGLNGGVICAGAVGNEDAFIEAIKKAKGK